MTSFDSYTMTEQVKKKVLLGGRGDKSIPPFHFQ